MADIPSERSDLTSFSQLVQELIGGAVRRHVFTPWELELLLDLETCRVRKSARNELLKRYLRTVQQNFIEGASTPPRLSSFREHEIAGLQPAARHGGRTRDSKAGLSSR